MDVPIVHVVRRFGRVGGMEAYVWNLVHGLAERGFAVYVVCEKVLDTYSNKITAIRVKPAQERPRWKSMLLFRERVKEALLEQFAGTVVKIHSHERCLCHHLTTFHGPPMTVPGKWNLIGKLNRRVNAWLAMESSELESDHVQVVLPVSEKISEQLVLRYRGIRNKVIHIGWPGISSGSPAKNIAHDQFEKNKVLHCLFVGTEWKRKGLERAVKVVETYIQNYGAARLTVYGPDTNNLPASIRNNPMIELKGWEQNIPWHLYSVLIHLARDEPFGMVIPEARKHGLSVLMSDQVGASALGFQKCHAAKLSTSDESLASALSKISADLDPQGEILWTWDNLVNLHVTTIYPGVVGTRICS
jgi:UDP-glucose:(heptosyl)LPS alpha-1,3-glucosyltransferase